MVRLSITLLSIVFWVNSQARIPDAYIAESQNKNISACLLYGIALNESKLEMIDGEVIAWPFSLNHRGKAYYFSNQTELIEKIKQITLSGDESFDVGATQINWKWHKHRYYTLTESTNPKASIVSAASFLSELKKQHPNIGLVDLAGKYHRPKGGKPAAIYKRRFVEVINKYLPECQNELSY